MDRFRKWTSSLSDRLQVARGSCPVCQIIAEAAVQWPIERYGSIPLGTWKDFIQRDQCDTCQQVVQYLDAEHGKTHSTSCQMTLVGVQEGLQIRCVRLPEYVEFTFIANKVQDYAPPQRILSLLRFNPFTPPYDECYIPPDPQEINVGQLKQWKEYCDADHGGTCHNLPKQDAIDVASPSILIDIQQTCLVLATDFVLEAPVLEATVLKDRFLSADVLATTPAVYTALSYVWGDPSGSLTTTKENLDDLRIPGSLEPSQTNLVIPRTVLDAMALTEMMGVRYLWVDRLCIVQDSSHKQKELRKMASIYEGSDFTIIAADGNDAYHGLRGIGGQALPRVYKKSEYEFSTKVKLHSMRESRANPPTWHTRAWTFQERAVSRRVLVFVDGTVYWQCRLNTWEEDFLATPEFGRGSILQSSTWPNYALTPRSYPDLRLYFVLVQGYNKRNLSFEGDALNAFTAIITVMSRSFRNGFHFGVPEFLFDIGLLWTANGPLKRRKDFPSWSWLGWSGNISFQMNGAWEPLLTVRSYLKVWPMIKWEKWEKPKASEKSDGQRQLRHASIDNSYHLYQNIAYDSDAMRSEGWTGGQDAFTHPNIREEKLRYPFPFPVSADLGEPGSDFWSPILSFRAERCTLLLGSSYIDDWPDNEASERCLAVNLNDSSGLWTGVIDSLFTSRNEYTQGNQCELIAISEASCQRKKPTPKSGGYRVRQFKEMEMVAEIKELELYEFYNVLWIERKEGIAYRKALGRVWKGAWDRQKPTMADVKLS